MNELGSDDADDLTQAFLANRSLLIAVAYRVLGSLSDAEDVAQEAWLRWSRVTGDVVLAPRPYLVKVTTRLAIDRLRRRQARRELDAGTWLPEPIGEAQDDPAAHVVMAESVSTGLLLLLETLSPLERATFVLREAFGYDYATIADIVGRTEPAVRQLNSRARKHVAERRARYSIDRATHDQVTRTFYAAVESGDMDALLSVLAPDVTLVADGGGKVRAPLLPVEGVEKVVRFLVAVASRPVPGQHSEVIRVDGMAGVVVWSEGATVAAMTFDISDGAIAVIYLVGDPDKLRALDRPR